MGPLRPTEEEVDRLVRGLDRSVLEPLRPSPVEVARLRARVRAPARRRRVPLASAGALLLAAVALIVFGLSAPEAPLPLEIAVTLGSDATSIGPSIQTWGTARIAARPTSDGATVEMEHGDAWFEVDPHGEARALDVIAGDVTVTVTGTRFLVSYDDSVTVRVERGSVRVTHPGGVETVRAGQTWTNAMAVAAGVPPAAPPVEVPPDPPAAASVPPAAPVAAAPPSAPVAAGVPPAAPPVAAGAEARAFAALLDAADRGDPDVVAQIEAFLSETPSGPLAAEAEVLRLEALARTSPAQAERAASAWLSANPRGSRRGDVLWLHATVARDGLQDCGLALPSYRELADTGPRRADAAALQGLCAYGLGRSSEALRALEKAEELGVSGPLAARVSEALDAIR